MTALDGIILGSIILCFLAIGLIGNSKSETTSDYFLAGRKLKWHHIGFSLFATNFSASALIGLTGAAYITGIAIYNYEWVGILALIFFALVLVGVVRGSQVYTISEYLTKRYDERVKTLYSAFIIVLIVFIDMAGSLYAGGLLLSEIIPNLSPGSVIFIIMIIAGLYSVMGGLKAITRTDKIQSLVLMMGAFMIAYYSLSAVGGWQAMIDKAPKGSMSLIRPLGDRAVPWTGLLMGIPVLSAYFWLTNQNMVQWVLSADTPKDARRGLLLAGALKLPILFIVVVPGVAAISLIPGLSEPDRIYPAMLLELLPAGVLGFVLAGFVAALVSNTDSTLHAASTIVTMDFIRRWKPHIKSKQLVTIGRLTTIIIIVFSAMWAPMIGNFGTLFEYIQGLLSYAVAPFVVAYLGGLFWPRATANGAIGAIIVGIIAALSIAIMGDGLNLFEIHYLHVPLPVTLISTAALILISLASPTPTVEPHLLWSKSRLLNEKPDGFKADKFWALALLFLTLALVVVFW